MKAALLVVLFCYIAFYSANSREGVIYRYFRVFMGCYELELVLIKVVVLSIPGLMSFATCNGQK